MMRFARELRRRRVFRTAGLYIVGAWLVMQAADVFFPAWGLPDAALNALLLAAILALPLALVFGWFYDVTPRGLVRTRPVSEDAATVPVSLQPADYLILGVLVLIAGLIGYQAVQDVLDAPVAPAPVAQGPVEPEPLEKPSNSVAVLAFKNISEDPANEFFCDGISEEILNRLSGFEELMVIARTSSFSFKGSDYRVPRISDLLGARFLLQGSVRKHGDRLRIAAQLVDEEGVQRWAGTYDRNMEDVFAIQTEIAESVATQVVPQIVRALPSVYKPELSAYEQYLAGRELVRNRRSPQAIERLKSAIAIDPNFAQAHAELAVAIALMIPMRRDQEVVDRALAAADRALALRPGLPRALAARGLALSQPQTNPTDIEAAEVALNAALAQDPNMVDALNWLSITLRRQGKEEEADRLLVRAYRLDPLHPSIASNYASGHAEGAQWEQIMLRLTALPTPLAPAFGNLRDFYMAGGRLVDMLKIARQSALAPTARHYYGLALSCAVLGLWERAEYWNTRFARDFPDFWFTGYNLANYPMWRGDYAEAVRIFDEQLAIRGQPLDDLSAYHRLYHGRNQALAGDRAGAVQTMSGLFPDNVDPRGMDLDVIDAWQALAWASLEADEPGQATALLEQAARATEAALESWSPSASQWWFQYALNAVLTGNRDTALERLERAVELGWREYAIYRHDPRLGGLDGDPRFQSLIAEVTADVERQRRQVEQWDDHALFVALLDRARESRAGPGTPD